MKMSTLKSMMLAGAVFAMIGCDSGDSLSGAPEAALIDGSTSGTPTADPTDPTTDPTDSTSILPAAIQAAIDGSSYKLSQELIDTLSFMGNEERLAYDVYNALYEKYGTKQFTKIATNGEYKHITAVQALVQKYKLSDDVNFTNVDLPPLGYQNTAIEEMEAGTYDIVHIQTLYDDLIDRATTEIEALKVGCIIEVVDVDDLDREILLAEAEGAEDVITIFNFLRDGSYSHYWAFDKGLKAKGESEGCCPLALELGHSACPDYPQK